tara:strand:- start:757 stop:1875 length:1119 start_codon:yes stop_codon:yes gene_type:complete
MAAASLPSFYIYEDAGLDHTGLLECVPSWRFDDQTAEASVLHLLFQHRARVHDAAQATLFVIPVLPYISMMAGSCLGTTHEARMGAAAHALRRQETFQRQRGRDHLLVSNTFRLSTLRALKPLLRNATVGWFEQPRVPRPGPNTLYKLAFWRCTVVVPYQPNPSCRTQALAHPHLPRSTSVFFQGSIGAGSQVRRRLATLKQLPRSHIEPFTRDNLGALAAGSNDTEHARRMASFSKTGSAAGMRASEFCIVPKGDTPTSSRLYSAIACGCVPLIIADHIRPHLAFSRAVDFERFVAFVPEGEFGRDPVAAVSNATARLAPRLGSIRDAMEEVAPDVLLEYEPSSRSRVVDHLLAEWRSDCEQPAAQAAHPE